MKKQSFGQKLIVTGNVLHGFVFAVLLLENIDSKLGVLYGICLLLLIPNIVLCRKMATSTNNSVTIYFIFIGLLCTVGFIGLFYIIGAILVLRQNEKLREEQRMRRVNV